MPWGYIASSGNVGVEVDGDGVVSVALGAAVAVGDRVIVGFGFRDAFSGAVTVDSVTDQLGNTYARDRRQIITEAGDLYQYAEVWSAPVTSAGTPTITVNISTADPTILQVSAGGYTGLDTSASPVDVVASAAATSSTAVASGSSANTTAANELVIGVIACPQNGGNTSVTPSGYTQRASSWSSFAYGIYFGDKDSGSSGTAQSISATLADPSNWAALAVVYKLAAAGGGGDLNAHIGEPITGSSVLN